jgi:hypothetical protein
MIPPTLSSSIRITPIPLIIGWYEVMIPGIGGLAIRAKASVSGVG